jgi:hypothetical protein
MKTSLLKIIAAALAFATCGCLQIEQIVTVNPDGSGTVTETILVSKAFVDSMKKMTEGLSGALGGSPEETAKDSKGGFDLFDEKKLSAKASEMGEGVTFVSAQKISNEKGEGAVATYAFKDINQLVLDQNPGSAMPQGPGGGPQPAADGEKQPLKFVFTKGKPSKLVIHAGADAAKTEASPAASSDSTDASDALGMQMAQQMFKDMKMTIRIKANGKITKTDAEYVDGATVTLVEMDFNKVLANPEKLKAMVKSEPKTPAEAKELLKGIDGLKIEGKREFAIEFQ